MQIKEQERIFEITVTDSERLHLIDILEKQQNDSTLFIIDFINMLRNI